MGREEDARAEAEEVLKINPNFSVETYARSVSHKNQDKRERYIEALLQAGLR